MAVSKRMMRRALSSEKCAPRKSPGSETPGTSVSPSHSAGADAAAKTQPEPRFVAGQKGVRTAARSGNSMVSNQIIADKVFRRFHGQWKADCRSPQQIRRQPVKAGR